MKDIIEIISLIIVSVGGTGTIILGISSFIGKIWANKFAEKHRVKFEKDIENYKSEINTKLNKLDKIQEKALYISKVNYDNEYKIYMEIWPKLIKCSNDVFRLYPRGIEDVPIDEKELEMYKKKKYKNFCDSYNKFIDCIDKYAPFYQEEYYDCLNKIKEHCFRIADTYKMYEFDVKYNLSFAGCRDLKLKAEERKEIFEREEEILKLKGELLIKIRTYLNGLKLKE